MALKKNDFLEVEFIGKTADGEVFDSNIKEELEKINSKVKPKPFIFSIGQRMFLPAIEDFLIGKELGKHTIPLEPEQAFGLRDTKLIQLIPESVFRQHNVRPVPGYVFNFDGKIAKILSANGGRVRVDFNNPLAGKAVVYTLNVKRVVSDLDEKIKSVNEFLFQREFSFKVEGDKLILDAPEKMSKFVELFKDKYKEIFNLNLEVKPVKEEKAKTNL